MMRQKGKGLGKGAEKCRRTDRKRGCMNEENTREEEKYYRNKKNIMVK